MRKFLFPAAFALVMISALVVRTIAAGHGLPYIYNFDEPNNTAAALQMLKTGDFNPHTFNYGTLLPYLDYISDAANFLFLMGRPDTASSYLTSMNDIHAGGVGNDPEWLWSISHPSFYFWNRMISVGLGLATIVMTFVLAKHATGDRWLALLAAALLASLGIHIEHSAYTTPDGPAACFIMGAVLFAFLFRAEGKRNQLVCSLVFCGLAVATKFGSALVIVVPITAVLVRHFYDRQSVNLSWLLLIPAVPAAVMLIAEPYSFLDSATFLRDVGFEIRHYKIMGHSENTSRPGLGQIRFQFSQFYDNFGLLNGLLCLVGLATALRTRNWLIVLYPILYFLYMAQMKVNFHRNFVQVYPFLAILVALGIQAIWKLVERRWSGATMRVAAVALVALFGGVQVVSSWISAAHALGDKDSRSRLVDVMNRLPAVSTLIVPSDLHIHGQDLRRLKAAFRVVSAANIASSCSKPSDGTALVLPLALAEDGETAQMHADQATYASWIARVNRGLTTVIYRVNGSPLYMDAPIRSPGLLVVSLSAELCASAAAH